MVPKGAGGLFAVVGLRRCVWRWDPSVTEAISTVTVGWASLVAAANRCLAAQKALSISDVNDSAAVLLGPPFSAAVSGNKILAAAGKKICKNLPTPEIPAGQ